MNLRAAKQLFEAKERPRRMLARMPIEEKTKAMVRLQKTEMFAERFDQVFCARRPREELLAGHLSTFEHV